MPGGSVNGRPFRESSDSYQKSGIPCGNPRRFQSKDVVRMGDAGYSKGPMKRPLSGPVEDIETEGQRQLQQLLNKQLDKHATYHQQISQRRQFQKSEAFCPDTEKLSGITDLSQFKDIEQRDAYIAELKHCGLSEEEITLKLEYEDLPKKQTKKRKYGEDPSQITEKLNEINKKIAERQERLSNADMFYGRKAMSRHEMELEKSLIQDNDHTKLLTEMLTTVQKDQTLHPDHPMNNLPEILKSLTNVKKESKRARRHHRQMLAGLCNSNDLLHVDQQSDNVTEQETDNTDIEVKHSEIQDSEISKTKIPNAEIPDTDRKVTKSNRVSDHAFQINTDISQIALYQPKTNFKTGEQKVTPSEVSQSKTREIQGQVCNVSEEDIIKDRLTIGEIRQLPRFENYTVGDPSNTLYIKNLSSKITEEDLVSLFIKFEDKDGPKIVFRLMTGRMKGQAFVTFKDSTVAQAALELVNGYKLKDKPLIIQFGRKG